MKTTTNKRNAKAAKPARTTKTAKKSPAKRLTKAIAVKKTVAKKLVPVAKKTTAKKVTTKPVAKKVTLKKEVKPNSQYKMVFNHLTKKGSINTKEAVELYGVLRLGALIFDLRAGGMDIETSTHTFLNKSGRKSSVAKYILQ